MPSRPLQAGDIIVESGSVHCVMWVDDTDKPLVHAAAGHGVIQQSESYFTKKNFPYYSWDHPVYRYKKADIATRAAEVAIHWARKGTNDTKTNTPFTDERWLYPYYRKMTPDKTKQTEIQNEWTTRATTWDAQAVFKILKAYNRSLEDNIPLSAQKGVSCSQFVIYCYQVAALQLAFGNQPITNLDLTSKNKSIVPQVDDLQTKESNALVAASEAEKAYAAAKAVLNKFAKKKDIMEAALKDFECETVNQALLPSLQVTTRFLTAEIVTKMKDFLKLGGLLPYRGTTAGKKSLIYVTPPNVDDPIEEAYEKTFGEKLPNT